MSLKHYLIKALCAICLFLPLVAQGQKRKPKVQIPRICGDPTVKCKTDAQFQPHDLPFEVKFDNNIPIQETELFFAVVLKTVKATDDNCVTLFIAEKDRQDVQKLFPRNKVFTDRCPEPGGNYYTGLDYKVRILAIYGGKTKAAADKILTQIKDQYPKASVRQMRAGFNGT